jgi:hypothetical protein
MTVDSEQGPDKSCPPALGSETQVSNTIRVRKREPWALVPIARTLPGGVARGQAEMYARSFRWIRRWRAPELCPSWRLGHEWGWNLLSPVDVVMTPLDDVEVAFPPHETDQAPITTNRAELWSFKDSQLSVEATGWTHLYQYRSAGCWKSMFVPNGAGTVAWHLELTLVIPQATALLILPDAELSGAEVPVGIIPSEMLARMMLHGGMSVPIRPLKRVSIRRGQPIARMALISRALLGVRLECDES